MGLFFNDTNEISEKLEKTFGDRENYLVAFKHNEAKRDLAKWLLPGGLYYTLDSNRSFVLYFSSKGIYENEISNTMKKDFLLMPWNEITSFEVEMKGNKAILYFLHLGKKVGYEIPFSGKIFKGNKDRLEELRDKEWNKLE